jgi:hypothetical protein
MSTTARANATERVPFTVAVVNADDMDMLLQVSAADPQDAAQQAIGEAAEATRQMDGLKPTDDEYDVELCSAMADTVAVRVWGGSHDAVPETEPVYHEG